MSLGVVVPQSVVNGPSIPNSPSPQSPLPYLVTFGETLLGVFAVLSLFCHLLLHGRRGLVIHGAAQGRRVVTGEGILQRERKIQAELPCRRDAPGLWLPLAIFQCLLPAQRPGSTGGAG